nr:dihydroorotate dehydrogenase [bacterium]
MNPMQVDLCGISLKNPVIAASGTAGFGLELDALYGLDKLGGIALKAVTTDVRTGNPVPRIAETPSGMLNAVGLQNPGVDAFLEEELPKLKGKDVALIANIAGRTPEDYCQLAERMDEADIDMVEMNISCPNVREGGVAFGVMPDSVREITQKVRARLPHKPLMVKLTPNTASIAACARAAEQAGADAVSLINTLTGMAIDVHTRRPILANVTGGLSGPAVMPVALRMVWETCQSVKIPVVGMGGITTGEDAIAFILAGATAVQVGTASLVDPWACPRIADEIAAYLKQYDIADIAQLRGALQTGI